MLSKKKRNVLIRAFLVAHYPNCFCPPRAIKRPLKINIFDDIHQLHPEISLSDLHDALSDYGSGPRYKAGLIEGRPRLDLHGNIVDYVTADQAERAREQLGRLYAKGGIPWSYILAEQQAAE